MSKRVPVIDPLWNFYRKGLRGPFPELELNAVTTSTDSPPARVLKQALCQFHRGEVRLGMKRIYASAIEAYFSGYVSFLVIRFCGWHKTSQDCPSRGGRGFVNTQGARVQHNAIPLARRVSRNVAV